MLPVDFRARRARQRGFSLIELLIVIAIILIILTLAVPQYNKMQMEAKEMAAVAALRTVNQTEVQYQSQFGTFASSLTQLGPPSSGGTDSAASAGLISSQLAAGSTNGYTVNVTQTQQGYAATAVPVTFGTTGRRTFYTDQTGVIRQNWGPEPATAASLEVGNK